MARFRQYIEDLTPFFDDRCWMFVLLARAANVGVILRRGPTEWWHVTLWDTRHDRFGSGQWFHGRIYPEKCDLSPDGSLFIYFAAKFGRPHAYRGYGDSWTAVSRPPYLTALALWPIGGTYGGRGVFFDDRSVVIGHLAPKHHPDHPPGPLRLLRPDCEALPCWQSGWQGVLAPRARSRMAEYRKACGDLMLGRDVPADYHGPSRRRTLYTLYRPPGEPVTMFEAHWADWDRRGRLVAAVGGRVVAGTLMQDNRLEWRQLADLHEERPTRLEAPDWAQHW
jgi:hypothetical protein